MMSSAFKQQFQSESTASEARTPFAIFGRSRSSEIERGSVKAEILRILWDGPRHAYDILSAFEEHCGFRPSPGTVYPALRTLEEGDFVTSYERNGKRIYTIAPRGSELLATQRETADAESNDDADRVALVARGLQAIAGMQAALCAIARNRNFDVYARSLKIIEDTLRNLQSLRLRENGRRHTG
jgi:DNA-binding PadR family transcriptional regulator